jgi:hypothetical protein
MVGLENFLTSLTSTDAYVYQSPTDRNSTVVPTTSDRYGSLLPRPDGHQVIFSFLVLRASNLPHLSALLGKERRFFATVTDGKRTWRSRPVRSVAQCAEWNEDVEAL